MESNIYEPDLTRSQIITFEWDDVKDILYAFCMKYNHVKLNKVDTISLSYYSNSIDRTEQIILSLEENA